MHAIKTLTKFENHCGYNPTETETKINTSSLQNIFPFVQSINILAIAEGKY
jgi:hypothetical protein